MEKKKTKKKACFKPLVVTYLFPWVFLPGRVLTRCSVPAYPFGQQNKHRIVRGVLNACCVHCIM